MLESKRVSRKKNIKKSPSSTSLNSMTTANNDSSYNEKSEPKEEEEAIVASYDSKLKKDKRGRPPKAALKSTKLNESIDSKTSSLDVTKINESTYLANSHLENNNSESLNKQLDVNNSSNQGDEQDRDAKSDIDAQFKRSSRLRKHSDKYTSYTIETMKKGRKRNGTKDSDTSSNPVDDDSSVNEKDTSVSKLSTTSIDTPKPTISEESKADKTKTNARSSKRSKTSENSEQALEPGHSTLGADLSKQENSKRAISSLNTSLTASTNQNKARLRKYSDVSQKSTPIDNHKEEVEADHHAQATKQTLTSIKKEDNIDETAKPHLSSSTQEAKNETSIKQTETNKAISIVDKTKTESDSNTTNLEENEPNKKRQKSIENVNKQGGKINSDKEKKSPIKIKLTRANKEARNEPQSSSSNEKNPDNDSKIESTENSILSKELANTNDKLVYECGKQGSEESTSETSLAPNLNSPESYAGGSFKINLGELIRNCKSKQNENMNNVENNESLSSKQDSLNAGASLVSNDPDSQVEVVNKKNINTETPTNRSLLMSIFEQHPTDAQFSNGNTEEQKSPVKIKKKYISKKSKQQINQNENETGKSIIDKNKELQQQLSIENVVALIAKTEDTTTKNSSVSTSPKKQKTNGQSIDSKKIDKSISDVIYSLNLNSDEKFKLENKSTSDANLQYPIDLKQMSDTYSFSQLMREPINQNNYPVNYYPNLNQQTIPITIGKKKNVEEFKKMLEAKNKRILDEMQNAYERLVKELKFNTG
jgi:hypothetical protein